MVLLARLMQHSSLGPTPLAIFTLCLAACGGLTPATTEDTTGDSTGGETTGGATETPTSGDPTVNPSTPSEPTTNEPTTNEPTTNDPTVDPSEGDGVTIYDIQQGKISEGTVVTLKNVIVTSPVRVKDENGTFFIQEAGGGEWSGITVYMYSEVVEALDAPPGTVLNVTGTYEEFFDNSQIILKAAADVEIVGQGDVPEAAVVAAADIASSPPGPKAENYEGVLVEIQDAVVTDPDYAIGQFAVEGGAIVGDFFLFTQGMSPKTTVGEVFTRITGPLLYSFDEFQIVPGSDNDLVSEDEGETNDTNGEGDTIYDLQMGNKNLGDVVVLEGVIATSGLTFKKDGFFIQDPNGGEWSGIYVYINQHAVVVAPGDVLTVTGTYDEFFDFSQVKIAGANDVVKTGEAPVPAPEVVNSADIATGGPKAENYESVLVRIENAVVTAPNNMFGEFEVNNNLFVDDLFFTMVNWPQPLVNANYASITGPLAYSFNEFKLSPRTLADFIE